MDVNVNIDSWNGCHSKPRGYGGRGFDVFVLTKCSIIHFNTQSIYSKDCITKLYLPGKPTQQTPMAARPSFGLGGAQSKMGTGSLVPRPRAPLGEKRSENLVRLPHEKKITGLPQI